MQGLWQPKTRNPILQKFYKLYGMAYRLIFVYIYTLTELMYFYTVTDLRAATNALYILITELSLSYKLQIYLSQYDRMLVCYDRLDTELFKPKNEEEIELVKNRMLRGFSAVAYFFICAQLFILLWAVTPFIDPENITKLPLAASYPYDTQSSTFIYLLTFCYQVFGLFTSSWTNISTDTLTASMLLHGITQLELLGMRLSKVSFL